MSDKEKKLCDCGCGKPEDECDCDTVGFDEDIVELTADDGKKLKFYFVGTIEYQGKNYSAFEPAEEIEGLTEDDLVIFELTGDEENTELLPIEDEAVLDAVFEEFCKALDEEEALDEAEQLDK